MTEMKYLEIFELIADTIRSGEAEFFYDYRLRRKCCMLRDMVFAFNEEEDGSLTMQYQNIFLLWVRETPGWEVVKQSLGQVTVDEDLDFSAIRRRVYESLLQNLRRKQ